MQSGDEMSNEIKPVYQRHREYDEWVDITEGDYKFDSLRSKYKCRILYTSQDYEALKAEDEISAAVIEKCSNILAQIAIMLKGEPKELTRHSYHDLPELVAVLHLENELNKVQMEEMLTAMRRAVLALAFAAESSAAMRDDYNALSAAIDKAVAANKGESS